MNTLERKLPIGIQTFEDIRQGNYLYVDKTSILWQIINTGKPYFLSRPRRFGKSLLISTLEAYFQGRKDLFEGLAIEKLEKKWEQYPVLHLDLNAKKYETAADLVAMLNQYLEKWEAVYGDEKKDRSPEERFSYVIEQACLKTGKGVVVLVDEYDKPLLQALLDENLLDEYRRILKAFYGVLKSSDRYLRFIFLTGVTKFAQVSVFSDLNQLNDISMKIPYANICGITKKELVSTFTPELERLAEVQEMSFDDTVDKMTAMYDGYHFTYSEDGLFNPFSVLNVFDGLMFDNYWFQTGTPTYLVDLLKQSDYDLRLLIDGLEVGSSGFAEYRAEAKNPLPMIYQSGYLTIKDFDLEENTFLLDYPNKEVKRGFLTMVASSYFSNGDTPSWIRNAVTCLKKGELDDFRTSLTSFLASIPYTMRRKENERERERYFHYTFYLLMRLISVYTVYTEKVQSHGRVDCIVETPDFVYIFEFKLDGTAEEALRQIKEKGYAREYEADQRKLYKIGAVFSSETGTIADWRTE